jgi:phosphoribosyl 1,2-cyclic phosphodiesterase
MKQRNGTLSADILLSHTHWDHIQGLPFFKPLSSRNTSVNIYGAAQEGVPLKDILGRQMDPMVFPVPLNALAASLTVRRFRSGRLQGLHYSSTSSRHHAWVPAGSILGRSRVGVSHRQ